MEGEDPEGAIAPLGRANPLAKHNVGCINSEHIGYAKETEDDNDSTL